MTAHPRLADVGSLRCRSTPARAMRRMAGRRGRLDSKMRTPHHGAMPSLTGFTFQLPLALAERHGRGLFQTSRNHPTAAAEAAIAIICPDLPGLSIADAMTSILARAPPRLVARHQFQDGAPMIASPCRMMDGADYGPIGVVLDYGAQFALVARAAQLVRDDTGNADIAARRPGTRVSAVPHRAFIPRAVR